MPSTTQLSLLDRVRTAADSAGWSNFVEVYQPYIETFLRRLELPEEDVRDICQDVMHVVIKEIRGFEHNGRKGAFRSWMRLVVANRLRSYRRAEAGQPRTIGGPKYESLAEQLVDANDPVRQLWEDEHNRQVVRGLLRVVRSRHTPQTLLAFRRVFFDEETAESVAKELGMTSNAVRIAQARVLRSLKRLGEGMIE